MKKHNQISNRTSVQERNPIIRQKTTQKSIQPIHWTKIQSKQVSWSMNFILLFNHSLSRLDLAQNLTQEDVFGEDLSDSSDDEQGERRKRGENGDGTQVQRQSLEPFPSIKANPFRKGKKKKKDTNNTKKKRKKNKSLSIHLKWPVNWVETFIWWNYRTSWKSNRSKIPLHLPSSSSFDCSRPYDPQYLLEEIRDDDDEESKARLKLQVSSSRSSLLFFTEGIFRLKTPFDGDTQRMTTARSIERVTQDSCVGQMEGQFSSTKMIIHRSFVRFSLSLHVGKEIFDVSKANIQNDHNHLFVRHQKSMQAQAVFRTKLSFR